jgi:hypothetical protein
LNLLIVKTFGQPLGLIGGFPVGLGTTVSALTRRCALECLGLMGRNPALLRTFDKSFCGGDWQTFRAVPSTKRRRATLAANTMRRWWCRWRRCRRPFGIAAMLLGEVRCGRSFS